MASVPSTVPASTLPGVGVLAGLPMPPLTAAGAHAASVETMGIPEAKVLKQQEWFLCPFWAAQPRPGVHLEVHKGGMLVDKIMIDASPYYMLGRNGDVVDIPLEHTSISRQHCVLVHHRKGSMYLIDLASNHGVHVNGTRVPVKQTVPIREGDEMRVGASTRIYKLNPRPPQKQPRVIEPGAKRPRPPEPAAEVGAQAAKAPRVGAASAATAPPPQQGRFKHILLKHTESRKPVSWRNPGAPVTRTKQEAAEQLAALRERVLAAPDLRQAFDTAAREVSDCSSAKKGGSLGALRPGQMLAAFDAAAFALQPGAVSAPVATESGMHLILRYPEAAPPSAPAPAAAAAAAPAAPAGAPAPAPDPSPAPAASGAAGGPAPAAAGAAGGS